MPEAATSDAAPALLDEQLSELIRQIPLAAAVNAVNALAAAWVFAQGGPPWPGPIAWLAVMVLVQVGRIGAWWRDRTGRLSRRGRVVLAFAGALLTGLTWGIGAMLLLPSDPAYLLVVVMIVGGMCAGAVTTNAAHLPSLVAFVLASCLPLTTHFLLTATTPSIIMGATALVFVATLIVAGGGYSRSLRDRLILQADLNDANRRLRREIAEREATEATLRQSQKLEAIGQLTAGIAHDFNNLMMVIAGHTEMLRASTPSPEGERRIAAIADATHRGSQLIRQLLAFGRRQRLQPRALDLNGLIGEMARLLDRTLGRTITVSFKPQDGLCPVLVDPGEMEHTLLNLAINARDAMPAGGVLTIEVSNAEIPPNNQGNAPLAARYVRVLVRDTGIGMSEEVLSRAIEPFFTTKPAGTGSGLGLSQVDGFVHQSGGTMLIRSRPNEGTEVDIHLPRAEIGAVSSNATSREPARHKSD